MADERLAVVTVKLLGGFEIGYQNATRVSWRSKKCTNLLAILLINHGRLVSRDRLERALWPNPDRPAGPTALKVVVHTLRRLLDESLGSDRDFLHVDSRDGGYSMRRDDRVAVDVHELDRLCREGREASRRGDMAEAVDRFGRAAGIYSGDFLADRGEEWVYEQREWLRSSMMHALSVLVCHASDIDDATMVVDHARLMLELDPTEERAFQAMILVHGRHYELEQATYWYDLCARRLAIDLDTVPREETRQLLLRAQRGDLVRKREPRNRRPSGIRLSRRGASRHRPGMSPQVNLSIGGSIHHS